MSTQPPQEPPEGWEPRPQWGASDRPTEPQWGPSERPTESQAGRWETYGPPAPSGQDHSAWAAQQRTQPERWQPRPSEVDPTQSLSDDERRAWLAQQVDDYVRRGWQIESRTENLASLRFGKPVNHVLHLLLTLVTCGLWALVWLYLAIFQGRSTRQSPLAMLAVPPLTNSSPGTANQRSSSPLSSSRCSSYRHSLGVVVNEIRNPRASIPVSARCWAWRQCRFAPDRTAPPGVLDHRGTDAT